MSRPAKNEMAAQELGMRLTELRANHPDDPSAKDAELWIFARYETKVSDESIRRAHAGQVDPTACDVTLLIALAAFYEVQPDALGRFASERIKKTMAMAASVPFTGTDPDGITTHVTSERPFVNGKETGEVIEVTFGRTPPDERAA